MAFRQKEAQETLLKNRVYKVNDVEIPSDMVITEVESPEMLSEIRGVIFDTPSELCLFTKGICFRYSKPSPPHIIKVEKLELKPDGYPCKVSMTQNNLFSLAKRSALDVLETSDGFYIVTSSLVFYAIRKGGLL